MTIVQKFDIIEENLVSSKKNFFNFRSTKSLSLYSLYRPLKVMVRPWVSRNTSVELSSVVNLMQVQAAFMRLISCFSIFFINPSFNISSILFPSSCSEIYLYRLPLASLLDIEVFYFHSTVVTRVNEPLLRPVLLFY